MNNYTFYSYWRVEQGKGLGSPWNVELEWNMDECARKWVISVTHFFKLDTFHAKQKLLFKEM